VPSAPLLPGCRNPHVDCNHLFSCAHMALCAMQIDHNESCIPSSLDGELPPTAGTGSGCLSSFQADQGDAQHENQERAVELCDGGGGLILFAELEITEKHHKGMPGGVLANSCPARNRPRLPYCIVLSCQFHCPPILRRVTGATPGYCRRTGVLPGLRRNICRASVDSCTHTIAHCPEKMAWQSGHP
jgi:hypothetical protein